jgi:hypothetical protein
MGMNEEQAQQPWLEKRPVQDTGIQHQQTSIDGSVTWMFNTGTGSYSMIDQRGMKHTYTALDTQRLLLFLASFWDAIDKAAATEQQRIDSSNPPAPAPETRD